MTDNIWEDIPKDLPKLSEGYADFSTMGIRITAWNDMEAQRTNDEITQYRYYYDDEIKDARQAMREKNIQLNPEEEEAIQEYSKRPVTQAAMLADAEKYQAYETLVFNYIWGKLTGILAKSCLQQVKELRALAQNTANTARLEAQKKAIKQQISALTLEERALIEEYLNMPVSRNGEAYYLFPQEQK